MDTHTVILNVLIALFHGTTQTGLQEKSRALRAAGYRLHAIERCYKWDSKAVHPDVIVLSNDKGHTLVVEIKGIPPEHPLGDAIAQLANYVSVTTEEWVTRVRISRPAARQVDIWAIAENRCDELANHVKQLGGRVTVSCWTGDGREWAIRRLSGTLSVQEINELLDEVTGTRPPYGFVRVNLHNLNRAMLLPEVLQQIQLAVARSESTITAVEVGRRLVRIEWELLSPELQNAIVQSVWAVMKAVSKLRGAQRYLRAVPDKKGLEVVTPSAPQRVGNFLRRASRTLRAKLRGRPVEQLQLEISTDDSEAQTEPDADGSV